MPTRELPRELRDYLRETSERAFRELNMGNYGNAKRIFEEQYRRIRAGEQRLEENERYHKGAILHNWGVSLLLQRRLQEGIEKIILAFIEDFIGAERFEQILDFPAHKALRSFVANGRIKTELLERIRQKVSQEKARGITVQDPETVLRGIVEPSIQPLTERPVSIDIFETALKEWLEERGKQEKRVFIGGNYKNIALLRHIVSIVEDIDNFKAAIPVNFPEDYPENIIYDVSMKILEGCSHAIFEISFSNGHLMEIERAKRLGKHTILLWQKNRTESAPLVTRMLMADGFTKCGYRNFTELASAINDFLLE